MNSKHMNSKHMNSKHMIKYEEDNYPRVAPDVVASAVANAGLETRDIEHVDIESDWMQRISDIAPVFVARWSLALHGAATSGMSPAILAGHIDNAAYELRQRASPFGHPEEYVEHDIGGEGG